MKTVKGSSPFGFEETFTVVHLVHYDRMGQPGFADTFPGGGSLGGRKSYGVNPASRESIGRQDS